MGGHRCWALLPSNTDWLVLTRALFYSWLPADRDKSAWFSGEISCEIAVRFWPSSSIYYNNFWKKHCLLIFSWLQTNIMASKAPTIENSVGKGTVFPFRLKKRQNSGTCSLNFLWDSIISCGLNPQIRGEKDSLAKGVLAPMSDLQYKKRHHL